MAEGALILIDGIKGRYEDLELFNVRDMESIDVFKGESTALFGARGGSGVISITTKGRNVADLLYEKETFNNVVYTPLGYQDPVEFYAPKYETLESKRSVIPDYRTTIFWKPDVVISESEEANFEFYTSDFQTTYSVVIEGVTDDGKIVRQVETIQVK